jgi:hypothetical protein
MILLVIESSSCVLVVSGAERHGQEVIASAIERSALLSSLVRQFDGQRCTTSLPLHIDAFMAWMNGTPGSLAQDAEVLNVRPLQSFSPRQAHHHAYMDMGQRTTPI